MNNYGHRLMASACMLRDSQVLSEICVPWNSATCGG